MISNFGFIFISGKMSGKRIAKRLHFDDFEYTTSKKPATESPNVKKSPTKESCGRKRKVGTENDVANTKKVIKR